MLNVGRKRAQERGLGNLGSLVWVEGDAEKLTFKDDSMDGGYTIAFGIRNVTHIEKFLAEAYRVLKRGGRFLCLELSHVDTPIFKQLYDYYSFSVIPVVGELVAGDRDSYQYLVESVQRFPPHVFTTTIFLCTFNLKLERNSYLGLDSVKSHNGIVMQVGRRLLQVSGSLLEGNKGTESIGIGTYLGWGMAPIYMGGRLPQIFLNIKRGNVQMAVLGMSSSPMVESGPGCQRLNGVCGLSK